MSPANCLSKVMKIKGATSLAWPNEVYIKLRENNLAISKPRCRQSISQMRRTWMEFGF